MKAPSVNKKKQSRSTSASCDVRENDNSARLNIVLDGGASEHAVNNLRMLTDIQKITQMPVERPNGTPLKTIHHGLLTVDANGSQISCRGYRIPFIRLNMLSCTRMDDYGITRMIDGSKCVLIDRLANRCLLDSVSKSHVDSLFSARLIPRKLGKGRRS